MDVILHLNSGWKSLTTPWITWEAHAAHQTSDSLSAKRKQNKNEQSLPCQFFRMTAVYNQELAHLIWSTVQIWPIT